MCEIITSCKTEHGDLVIDGKINTDLFESVPMEAGDKSLVYRLKSDNKVIVTFNLNDRRQVIGIRTFK